MVNVGLDDAIKGYVFAHIYEASLLDKKYPDAVFVSHSRPKMQKPISNLPTLFVYPLGRGRGHNPWYEEGFKRS